MSDNFDQNKANQSNDAVAAIVQVMSSFAREQYTANAELLKNLNEIHSAQQLTNERLARVVTMTESHEGILRGNGKVGVLTRLERLEGMVFTQHSDLKDVVNALRGEEDDEGLIGRVAHMERRIETIAKPMLIVMATVITSGIGLIIASLVK